MISREEFLNQPVEQVAAFVRAAGPKVAVFPINGTRRWFALEYGASVQGDPVEAYMSIAQTRHIEIYRLFFDHGVDTLVTPVFGSELFGRGDAYVRRIGMAGIARLAQHPEFLKFYDDFGVRIRFYGDYRRELQGTEFGSLIDVFEEGMRHTRNNDRARLFFGVFASDATETLAGQAIDFYLRHGHAPTREEQVEQYYGEHVEPASFFLGFDRFTVFDYPLLGSGEEDLYFTVAPSPYLTERQLREILFDHIYTRRAPEPDYSEISPENWAAIKSFYHAARERTFGIGELRGGIWSPLHPIELPQV
jgi:tuberculosinol/isotuberculosinol synthase